jgi:hypothetical protein
MNLILIIFLLLRSGIDDNVKQEYVFIDNNIQFKMKIDNLNVDYRDTLLVEIEVINESEVSIYVVPTFHFTYIVDSLSNIPNAIYLDFGGGISGRISDVPFNEIKPKEVKVMSEKFICDNFRYNKFSDEIFFSLWLGYVHHKGLIENRIIKDSYIYLNDDCQKDFKNYLVGSIKILYNN